MKTNQITILLAAIIFFSVSSCKKYSDGPLLSLRSKTERVSNNWKVGQAYDGDSDVTGSYNKYELDLTKTGSASLTANYKIITVDYDYTTKGTWAFVSNKDKISFDFDNNNADGVYEILRLKEDEMWLKRESDKLELHFVPR